MKENAEKEILIILPGWRHNRSHWQQVQERLSGSFEVHFFDFPGFGVTPADSTLNTVEAVAKWTKQQIETYTDGKQFVICGHSFGGRIAGLLATQGEMSISKLILVASPNIYRPTINTKVIKLAAKLLRPIKAFLPGKFRESFRSDDYAQAVGSELSELYQDTILNDQTSILPSIAVPTLLIGAEYDTAAPPSLIKEVHKLIPNSEMVILNAVGHDIHIEKPDLLSAKIKNYVSS